MQFIYGWCNKVKFIELRSSLSLSALSVLRCLIQQGKVYMSLSHSWHHQSLVAVLQQGLHSHFSAQDISDLWAHKLTSWQSNPNTTFVLQQQYNASKTTQLAIEFWRKQSSHWHFPSLLLNKGVKFVLDWQASKHGGFHSQGWWKHACCPHLA